MGYQVEDEGPLLRIEDRETVETLVEYLNRYQYQGVSADLVGATLRRSGFWMKRGGF